MKILTPELDALIGKWGYRRYWDGISKAKEIGIVEKSVVNKVFDGWEKEFDYCCGMGEYCNDQPEMSIHLSKFKELRKELLEEDSEAHATDGEDA